jgi:hypothetical protein
MIIQNFFGGIGNQLFQYAAAYSLSLKIKKKIFYDYSLFSSFKFAQNNKIKNIFRVNIYKNKRSKFFYFLFSNFIKKIILRISFLNKFQTFYMTENNFYKFKNYSSDPILMLGYWQDINFFLNNEEELKNNLVFRKFKKNKVLLSLINIKNSVSIHIRMGDYLSKKNNVNYVLPIDYYISAIHIMNVKLNNPFYFIFSDEKNLIHLTLAEQFKKNKFILVNTDKDYKDLYYMTLCKHNIMSNSTFSWWGAWLNKNKKKLIIYPKTWFKNNMPNPNIFYKDWIKL